MYFLPLFPSLSNLVLKTLKLIEIRRTKHFVAVRRDHLLLSRKISSKYLIKDVIPLLYLLYEHQQKAFGAVLVQNVV